MTSINAIRFDRSRGAILVDETISTGGNQSFHGSDKVRDVIPQVIQEHFQVRAGLAGTGSCAFTNTIKVEFHDRLLKHYQKEVEKSGGPPGRFLNLDAMARELFDLVVEVKNRRMSERFQGEFGFDVPSFLEGKSSSEEGAQGLKDEDLVRRLTSWMSWQHQEPEVGGIFLNALLFAGFDPELGFQIYHVDLRDGYWHKVQTCYMAEGSGRFSVDPTMVPYVEGLRVDQRRGEVDPVGGLLTLFAALNAASRHETGVGGYPTLMLFDGRPEASQSQRVYCDDRAWLGSTLAKAWSHGFLARSRAEALIEDLFWNDAPLAGVEERFWQSAEEPETLERLLRGYKVPSRSLQAAGD